ncbi:MAG: terpene cyclase/mutase family protein [Planctomycetota bacterium]|nr:terpene cyclase/mutase family protein [Planctomycetota bacterium]
MSTAQESLPSSSFLEAVEDEEDVKGPPPPGFFDQLSERMGSSPWWVVSGAFHGLLLLMLTLIGWAVLRAPSNDMVIVTNLEKIKEPEYQSKVDRDFVKNPKPVESEAPPVEHPVVTHEEVEVADRNETMDDSDQQSAKGDEMAVSDVPLGGTGTSASLGVGGGGGGAFGQRSGGGRLRLAMRGGGGKATESAVDAGLAWLARHQEEDGHWANGKHGGGSGSFDVAVTGLATLAFLGAGHTDKIGKHQETVRRALKFILSKQDANGYIGGCGYTHAICTMALAEAYGMSKSEEVGTAAQKAVTWATEKHQTLGVDNYDRSGWEYTPRGQRPTTAVTAWFIMSLKSAKVAGLHVDPAGFEGGLHFLDSVTKADPHEAAGAYNVPDVTVYYRPPDVFYKGGAIRADDHVRRMQATGLLVRMFTGSKRDNPTIEGGVKKVMSMGLPDWSRKDVYHWYYGTYVMFQAGGDEWKQWNDALKNALLPNQVKGPHPGACLCKNNDDDGSWDPSGESYVHKSRVWVTTAAVLSLEVYYRYLRMYK